MLQIQNCESAEATACELFEQAIQLQHEDDLAGAVSLLHQAIEIYPCDHRFFVELSNVLCLLGMPSRAEKFARTATVLGPADWCSWFALSGTLLEQGLMVEAQQSAIKADSVCPAGLRAIFTQNRLTFLSNFINSHLEVAA